MNFKIITRNIVFSLAIFTLFSIYAEEERLPICTVTIINSYQKNIPVQAEIADTQKSRTYGLMNRKSLAKDSGMIFIYKSNQYLNFWMKNVSFPLSIAFINSSGIIKDIQKMKPLDTSVTYLSNSPVRYALEVNLGFFDDNKIKIGDKVVLDGCIGK